MKRFIYLAIAAMTALTTGCDNLQKEETVNNEGAFIGTVVVSDATTGQFSDPDISVQLEKNSSGTYDLQFNQVKFASAMPVRLDITVPGVSIAADGTISGDQIIPLTMGGEYPRYTVTSLKGTLGTDKNGQYKAIEFSLNFGPYPTSYSGDFVAFRAE